MHSNAGDAVLVPFGGSGSECVSAAIAGRNVLGYELADEYYQLMLQRAAGCPNPNPNPNPNPKPQP